MASRVTWPGLPLLLKVAGRPVMLLGDGEAADAKRRLLERAGAVVVGENAAAALAVVAIDDEAEALAAVARLKAAGVLVNAVDRPEHCDFTLPAIVDRSPVLVAVATGGASAGLAAALRQRLEALLPARLGELATELFAARGELRERWPDGGERRRALARGMAPGEALDPLGVHHDDDRVWAWMLSEGATLPGGLFRIALVSREPDDLTLRQARALAQADRVYHTPAVPPAILDRARADAVRVVADAPPTSLEPGVTIWMELGR